MSDPTRLSTQTATTAKTKTPSVAGPQAAKPPVVDPKHDLAVATAAALLMRDAVDRVETALGDRSMTRRASAMTALVKVINASRELVSLAALQPIDWQKAIPELEAFAGASTRLRASLRVEGLDSMVGELASSFDELKLTIGATDNAALAVLKMGVAAPAAVPKVAGMTADDEVELGHQAVAAARLQVAKFNDAHSGADRAKAIQLCAPIPRHLATASDAALAVIDRSQRLQLTNDVEATSKDLDAVAQTLTMTPQLKWDETFAQMFDAENDLRKTLGLAARARPYSGRMDPEQAEAIVKGAANDTSSVAPDYRTQDFDDPASAVQGITIGLTGVYEQQTRAIGNIATDLAEPPAPTSPTIFETILDIAVNMALGGAAGAIGGALAEKLKKSFEGLSKTIATDAVSRSFSAAGLSAEEKAALVAKRVQSGALGRAAAVDAAKDATKQMFKDSVAQALKTKSKKPLNAAHPLNAFVERQKEVLGDAQIVARLMMVHLASALGQLDVSTLNAMFHSTMDVRELAPDLQYEASMKEFQNFKARLEGLPADTVDPKHPGAPSGDVMVDLGRVSGILDARVAIDGFRGSNQFELESLVLRGGEPAAIRHFKNHPRSLAASGMHQRYRVKIGDKAPLLTLGVGPSRGLRTPSSIDLGMLKAYASGNPVSDVMMLGTVIGAYDHIPDAVALNAGLALVAMFSTIMTTRLEEP